MGDVIVKIKENKTVCELGKPVYLGSPKAPNFQCKIQGVVIQGGGANLLSYPICKNQDIARGAPFNLVTDDLFWYSLDTDEGVPYTLARVRPII